MKAARIFLIVLFILWAFRLVVLYEAHLDAIGMLILSLLTYESRNNKNN